MEFASVNSLTQGAQTQQAGTGKKEDLGKNEFLKLMMAQMQQQDPLAPQDNNQMLAQLAQFSGLEQMQNLNTKFDDFVGLLSLSSNVDSVSYIGKEVRVEGDQLLFDGQSDSNKIYWKNQSDASETSISIFDKTGRKVREIQVGYRSSGNQISEWDGRDENGNKVPAGNYTVEVNSKGSGGNMVPVSVEIRGKVEGVNFDEGFPQLVVGGRKFRLGDIKSIHEEGAI